MHAEHNAGAEQFGQKQRRKRLASIPMGNRVREVQPLALRLVLATLGAAPDRRVRLARSWRGQGRCVRRRAEQERRRASKIVQVYPPTYADIEE